MHADTDNPSLNQPPGPRPSIDSAESLDIDAERVDHLLIVKAFADDLDLVGTVNRLVPTQMGVKPGIVLLGLVLDTLTGRSPLYRLVDFFEGRDTELLLGERVAASAFNDDTLGRLLDLLFETGTQRIFSEGANQWEGLGQLSRTKPTTTRRLLWFFLTISPARNGFDSTDSDPFSSAVLGARMSDLSA